MKYAGYDEKTSVSFTENRCEKNTKNLNFVCSFAALVAPQSLCSSIWWKNLSKLFNENRSKYMVLEHFDANEIPYGRAKRLGVPQLQTKFNQTCLMKTNQKMIKCMHFPHAPEKTPRARKGCLQLSFLEGGPRQTPGLLGWAGRARARARARAR